MSNDVWEMIPFTSAVDVMSDEGKRLKQRDYLEQGKIPVIDQGEAFIGGYTNDDGMSYKGELPVIIFGDHTRRIKLVNHPFAVGADGVKILKPKPFYRPKFFFFFLQSLEIPSRGYSRHFQFLRSFEFVKTTPKEQDRVVAKIEKQFSRLDEAVASLKRIQANIKRYKASVLKAAVEGKLTEQWRKDHPNVEPADQLLKSILTERRAKWEAEELAKMKAKGTKPKDDSWKKKYNEPAGPDTANLPELPVGWVWASIEQLAGHIVDGTHHTPTYVEDGIDFISAKDIDGWKIDFSRCRKIPQEEHTELIKRCYPQTGHVLISKSGTIGRVAIVKTDKPFSLFESVAVIPLLKFMSSEFIAYAVFSGVQGEFGKKWQKGVAVRHLHLEDLRRLPIQLPPLKEQEKVVQAFEQQNTIAENVEKTIGAELVRSERLRQTILKKTFSNDC